MNYYFTTLEAIDPIDGQLKTYSGPIVMGISWQDAERYLVAEGMQYLKIEGRVVKIIYMDGTEEKPNEYPILN